MTKQRLDIQEHFVVPEGYFENFKMQMMDMLPEQDYQPMQIKSKSRLRYYSAAAAIVLVLISITSILSKQDFESAPDTQAHNMLDIDPTNGVYTVEDAADCAMINKITMYEMITE